MPFYTPPPLLTELLEELQGGDFSFSVSSRKKKKRLQYCTSGPSTAKIQRFSAPCFSVSQHPPSLTIHYSLEAKTETQILVSFGNIASRN